MLITTPSLGSVLHDKRLPTAGLALIGILVLFLAYRTEWSYRLQELSLLVPTPSDNEAKFFRRRNLTAASWKDANRVRDDCIMRFVEQHGINEASPALVDWEEAFPMMSNCPVYPVPPGGLYYHIFWRGAMQSHIELTIKAFLATQRLRDGHKLIYWYEGLGPTDDQLRKYATFTEHLEFRRFEKDKESRGTCLESMPEWASELYQRTHKLEVFTFSDLVRLLLLSKYGGVWLDADDVLLRDLTPLIRTGPSAPYKDDLYNNNLLIYGPVSAGVGRRALAVACTMPYSEELFKAQFPNVKVQQFYWLYNDGLHKMCSLPDNACGIAKVPIEFVDGRCWGSSPEFEFHPCESGLFHAEKAHVPAAFGASWTWHARLQKMAPDELAQCWLRESGTLLSLVSERVDQLLQYGASKDGRMLFGGPHVM